ncbi:hypothetical protein [Rhodococcus gannanensis]|uniref:Integral membrane protein n=1 Tax=Rhodococcus gannanensis TaxID=1960308 RepID=A0ABW4P3D7_9NOCA
MYSSDSETPFPPCRRRSVVDIVAAAVLAVLAVAAGWFSVVFSALLVMVTDSCGYEDCNEGLLPVAYGIIWTGILVAAIILVVGTVWAVVSRHTVFWWPLIAILTIVGTFVLGVALIAQVNPS